MITKIVVAIIIYYAIKFKINELKRNKKKRRKQEQIDFLMSKGTSSNLLGNINNSILGIYDESEIHYMQQGHQRVKGTYVIFNKNRGLFYVGQSVDCIQRTRNHLVGRGNHGVYRDKKKGNEFLILIILFDNKFFRNLNHQEKYFITFFDSYYQGYNGTRGNRG